jgi:hypothetical protein
LGKFCFNFKLKAFDDNADANEAIEADANKTDVTNKVIRTNLTDLADEVIVTDADEANKILAVNEANVMDKAIVTNNIDEADNVIVAVEANAADKANKTDKARPWLMWPPVRPIWLTRPV